MEQAEVKVFRDLQEEVILRDLCGKCGGCVSFCTAGTLNALELGEDDLPRCADMDKCPKCGICYMICPLTKDTDAEVRTRFGWGPPIGIYSDISSGRSTDEPVQTASPPRGHRGHTVPDQDHQENTVFGHLTSPHHQPHHRPILYRQVEHQGFRHQHAERRQSRQGYIEERKYKNSFELRSEKPKMMAKVVTSTRQKRRRGEERLAG